MTPQITVDVSDEQHVWLLKQRRLGSPRSPEVTVASKVREAIDALRGKSDSPPSVVAAPTLRLTSPPVAELEEGASFDALTAPEWLKTLWQIAHWQPDRKKDAALETWAKAYQVAVLQAKATAMLSAISWDGKTWRYNTAKRVDLRAMFQDWVGRSNGNGAHTPPPPKARSLAPGSQVYIDEGTYDT